ncbi:hypothetical protein EZS27_031477 [termite gut metagenome]|uniref:Uncharacterized protein n=1 Tax=termite gut metagenome TaxID=433724 RepID=A0A5J4Q9R2_9ZZZZ
MEIGIFIRIRNDSHLKRIVRRIAYRQAYSVYSHRTLINSNVSMFGGFFVVVIFEGIIPATVRIFYVCTDSSLVNIEFDIIGKYISRLVAYK